MESCTPTIGRHSAPAATWVASRTAGREDLPRADLRSVETNATQVTKKIGQTTDQCSITTSAVMGSLCGFEPSLSEPQVAIYPDMATAPPLPPRGRSRNQDHPDSGPARRPVTGSPASHGRKPRLQRPEALVPAPGSPASGDRPAASRTSRRPPEGSPPVRFGDRPAALRPTHRQPRRGPRPSSDRTPPRAPTARAGGREPRRALWSAPATPPSYTRRRTIITGAPPRAHGWVARHATVTPPPHPAPEAGARRTYAPRATGVAPEDRTACGGPRTAAYAVGDAPRARPSTTASAFR